MLKQVIDKFKSLLPRKQVKLDDIVSIKESGSLITVEIKKDMLLKIDGNVLSIVEGLNVSLAKEIHLNPNIPNSMEELELNIEAYKKEQIERMKREQISDCNCKDKKDETKN